MNEDNGCLLSCIANGEEFLDIHLVAISCYPFLIGAVAAAHIEVRPGVGDLIGSVEIWMRRRHFSSSSGLEINKGFRNQFLVTE